MVGLPWGGDSLSVTVGVVSRVDMKRYGNDGNKLLAIQIDAAINPGNSGGPAFSDIKNGKVRMIFFDQKRRGEDDTFLLKNGKVSMYKGSLSHART